MEPQSKNRGGLLGQLRDSALKGSDNGNWNEPVAQKNIRSHTTSLRGCEGDSIRVELESERVVQRNLGRGALRTFYSLRASYIEGGLVLECLPENVIEVLRRKKVAAGEEQEVRMIVINDEEIDEHEFEGYEDMNFRHVRSLEFVLNGRGSLLKSAREDFYEDDDAIGGVDIVGVRTEQFGNHEQREAQTVSLQGWGKSEAQNDSTELLLHPDLLKLEAKTGVRELREDMSFLDIVEQYKLDKNLSRHSRIEQRQTMLTLLAFLNYDASSSDIQDLL